MTAQFSDQVFYKGEEFALAGVDGGTLITPEFFGYKAYKEGEPIDPLVTMQFECSACSRGYAVVYEIKEKNLLLKELKEYSRYNWNSKSGSDGKSLEEEGLNVPFHREIVICKDFIEDCYVHMGFQKPSAFQTVLILSFSNGQLENETDISSIMAKKRGEFKERFQKFYETNNDVQGIEEAYSLTYGYNETIVNDVDYGKKNGTHKRWHDNGAPLSEVIYMAGRREGAFKAWHDNGQLWKETSFSAGKIEGGFKSWHENGQLESEGFFKNGQQEGVLRWWHDNGRLAREYFFKEGKMNGIFKEWDENSKLLVEESYKDNKLVTLFDDLVLCFVCFFLTIICRKIWLTTMSSPSNSLLFFLTFVFPIFFIGTGRGRKKRLMLVAICFGMVLQFFCSN